MIYSLECHHRRPIGSGSYLSDRVVFGTWQTACLNLFSRSKWTYHQHLSPLSHCGYFLAFENSLTSALFKLWNNLSCWSSYIPILIIRLWLYVDPWWILIRRSTNYLHAPPDLVVSPTFVSHSPNLVVYQQSLTMTISLILNDDSQMDCQSFICLQRA